MRPEYIPFHINCARIGSIATDNFKASYISVTNSSNEILDAKNYIAMHMIHDVHKHDCIV